jgi:hypothetical protein
MQAKKSASTRDQANRPEVSRAAMNDALRTHREGRKDIKGLLVGEVFNGEEVRGVSCHRETS